MKKNNFLQWLLIAPLALFIVACSSSSSSDDDKTPTKPGGNTGTVETLITEIKFTNAGVDGKEILEGIIDEDKKLITFPPIDPMTNLSAVKFEAKLSEGAKLDQETYDFTMKEGDTEVEKVIKVLNEKKTGEYIVKLELDVITYGGDFDQAKVFDHSANGTIYPAYTGNLTRAADFDENYILIVHRTEPQLLKVDDVIAGNANNPLKLNTEGVEGGTFSISAGKLAQDRVYICNLAGGLDDQKSALKVYMWETPQSKPTVVFSGEMLGSGTGRYGDSMDMYLDEGGNGFMFFENKDTGEIDRLQVKNFTEIIDQILIVPIDKTEYKGGQYFSYSKVINTPYYIYTGYEAPLMLVDEDGNPEAMVSLQENTKVPTAINQAKVIEFGGNRYLIAVTASRNDTYLPQKLIIFDISKGSDIIEAIENLNENATDPKIVYEYTFGKDHTISPGTNAAVAIRGNKLYAFGSADNNGFVLVEVPEKDAN